MLSSAVHADATCIQRPNPKIFRPVDLIFLAVVVCVARSRSCSVRGLGTMYIPEHFTKAASLLRGVGVEDVPECAATLWTDTRWRWLHVSTNKNFDQNHARLLSPLGFLFGFAAGQASLRPSAAPTSRFTTTRWVASHSQLVHGAMGAESSPTGDIVAVLEYVEKGGVDVLRLAFHFCVS